MLYTRLASLTLLSLLNAQVSAQQFEKDATTFDRYGFATTVQNTQSSRVREMRAQAKVGGTLKAAVLRPMDLIWPGGWRNGAPVQRAAINYSLMYPSLMTGDPSAPTSTLRAQIAKHINIDFKAKELNIELKPEAAFWDGSQVTAEDIKKSWDYFVECYGKKAPFMVELFGQMKLKVVSPLELTFTFPDFTEKRLREGIFYLLYMPIVKAWTQPSTVTTIMPYMGAGRFQPEFFQREFAILKRISPHWMDQSENEKGLNNFSTIEYRLYADTFAQQMALAAGTVNIYVADRPGTEEWLASRVREKGIVMHRLKRRDVGEVESLNFNIQREHMNNKEFRSAIFELFEFDAANRLFHHNRLHRFTLGGLSEFVPKGPITAPAAFELKASGVNYSPAVLESLSESALSQSLGERTPKERVQRASEKLIKLGYTRGKSGQLELNGRPVTLSLVQSSREVHKNSMALMIQLMKRLGIEVIIRELSDGTSFANEIKRRNYDMILSSAPFDPDFSTLNINFLRQRYHSTNAAEGLTFNPSRLKSPLVDWTLEQLADVMPTEERFAPLAELLVRAVTAEEITLPTGDYLDRAVFVPKNLCTPPAVNDVVSLSYFSEDGTCPTFDR